METNERWRIIFLDIDGVLVPGRHYLAPGRRTMLDWLDHPGKYQAFDPLGVGIVRRIHQRFSKDGMRCAVVTCTVWNRFHETLEDQMRLSGLAAIRADQQLPGMGAKENRTTYPWTESRLGSILAWVEAAEAPGREILWVALDDAQIDDPRAVPIHAMDGICVRDYEAATRILGDPDEVCMAF